MNIKLLGWDSTPISNVVNTQSDAAYKKLFLYDGRAMHEKCRPPVEGLKAILGRQKGTLMSWHRTYFWEGKDWRIFASKRGVTVEVREGLSKPEAWAAWDDAMRAIGVNPVALSPADM